MLPTTAIALISVPLDVLTPDPSMRPNPVAGDVAPVNEANQVGSGNVEQIGGLLCSQLLGGVHDRDAFAALEMLQDLAQDAVKGIGQWDLLAIWSQEGGPAGSAPPGRFGL